MPWLLHLRSLGGRLHTLGIGLYQTDKDDRLLRCNTRFRGILDGIPGSRSLRGQPFSQLYADARQRERFLYHVRKNGGEPFTWIARLRFGQGEGLFRETCQCTFSRVGRVRHYFGSLAEVMPNESYLWQIQGLPIGFYELDEEGRIVRANDFLRELFGLTKESVRGFPVRSLYLREAQLKEFLEDLSKHEVVSNKVLDMKRLDGTPIIIQTTTRAVVQDGKIRRRYGVFTDVTETQRCVRALEALPVGYYAIEERGGREIIQKCNQAFATMFGYNSPDEICGRLSILDLYAKQEDHGNFLKALSECEKTGRPLTGYRLLTRRRDRSTFWIEIDCRAIGKSGEVLLREGTVKDVSVQTKLEAEVEELSRDLKKTTTNLDRFLHQYIAPMLRLDSEVDMTAQMLSALDVVASAESKPDRRNFETAGNLLEVLAAADNELEDRGNSNPESYLRDRLSALRVILQRELRYRGSEVIAHVVERGIAIGSIEAVKEAVAAGLSPGGEVKNLMNRAREVLSQAVLRSMKGQKSETHAQKSVIEAFRKHLSRAEVRYEFREYDIVPIVVRNIELYTPMVAEKRRRFRYIGGKSLHAEIAYTHVDRMVSNLLLNAVKYSHLGRRSRLDYIYVRTSESADEVEISVTNYGVPIERGEIESGEIYTFGYRGKQSRDYNRSGSGIGLADIHETVRAHGGEVEVRSVPADEHAAIDDYSQPFMTTVTVRLPKMQLKGGEDRV